jgi:putative flippase GtrA
MQFVRFLLVGLLNTAVGYAIFAALLFAGAGQTPAIVAATILGVLFNFRSIGRLVFGGSGGRLVPFVAVYVVQCGANVGMMQVARRLGMPPLAAEAVVLPLLAVATFAVMRGWVFAGSKEAREGGAREEFG